MMKCECSIYLNKAQTNSIKLKLVCTCAVRRLIKTNFVIVQVKCCYIRFATAMLLMEVGHNIHMAAIVKVLLLSDII